MQDATKPTYLEVRCKDGVKKVSMISLTTTFIDAARAGNANSYFPGRPGINPLRHKDIYYVTEDELEILKTIAKKTCINGERDNARKIGSLPPEEKGTFNFGGLFFKKSETEGKNTICNEQDLKRILDSIEEAKNNADYVIVAAHSHQIKHEKYTEPDYFFEEFCHKCIDAGASCIIGGGTHQLKPIEIYKKKPIFYSLGNFIFQLEFVEKLPSDFWEKYNFSKDLSINEAKNLKSKNGTVGLEMDFNNYLSVIPLIEFDENEVKSLYLKPIELGFEKKGIYKGLPCIATKEKCIFIKDYLQEISEKYGTKFNIEKDLIRVVI